MVRVSVSRGSIKRSGSGIGLENQNLIFSQRGLRNAVTGLDQRRVFGFFSGVDARYALKEVADRHGVGGVVCPWSMTFSTSASPITLAVI